MTNTRPTLANLAFTLCGLILSTGVLADVLGSFDGTWIHPGHLDFDPKSSVYLPNIKLKHYDDNVDRRTPSQILASFLTQDRVFDFDQARVFIEKIITMEDNAFLVHCSQSLPKDFGGSGLVCKQFNWRDLLANPPMLLIKLFKKWEEHEFYRVCELAMSEMKRAQSLASSVNFRDINHHAHIEFINAFFTAIEALEAAKAEDAQWGNASSRAKYVGKIGISLTKNFKIKANRVEAANILIPRGLDQFYASQLFFSPEQLTQLENLGTDTSLFDPPSSGFWRKPAFDLNTYDTATYGGQGLASLRSRHSDEEIAALLDPDRPVSVMFIMPSKSEKGTTPKVLVRYGKKDQKWKLKFLTDAGGAHPNMKPSIEVQRLFVSSEVNVEPAVNNLANMIGYTVDPTYYKKTVRLYFPQEAYGVDGSLRAYLEEQVMPAMKAAFPPSWNIRSAFEQIKTDAVGKQYIEIKGATFEKKSDLDTDQNISLFVRHGLGKSFKREFRAFALFLALIQDPDVKDDNTKIKLVPGLDSDGKPTMRLVFSASDMGVALGLGFPNLYPRDFVKHVRKSMNGSPQRILLNYKSFFKLPIFDALSLADSRWLMRLIARIPPAKIRESFLSGGYPVVVAEYYTEVFLRRCHQLYDVLGMKNGIVQLDGSVRPLPRESMMTDKHTFYLPGYEQFFRNGVIFDPENLLMDPTKEHFARDWGTSLHKGTQGRHKENLYKVMTKGLKLEAGNFVQKAILGNFKVTNINMFGGENSLIPVHNGFFGGFSAGMDWFIPMRFVIDNPTSDAVNHPYWVVDMFRLATVVTAGSGAYYYMSGLNPGTPFGAGGEVAIGRDVIRIRPTADYATAYKHADYVNRKAGRDGVGPTKKFFFKDLDKQLLERMKPGDILVNSTFVGVKAMVTAWGQVVPSVLMAGFQSGVEAYLTKRSYVTRTPQDAFLVNWSDVKRITAFSNGFLRMAVLQVPLVSANYVKRRTNNSVYQFDWKDVEAQKTLIANVNESNAAQVPTKYSLQGKLLRTSGLSFMANILGIRTWRATHSKTEITGQNFITGEHAHELAYEHTKHYRALSHWDFIDARKSYTRAQINERGDIFGKIDFNYYLNEASKADFLKFYGKFNAILPPDLVLFDPGSVKEYLGNLELKALVVLGPRALKTLLGEDGPSDFQLCSAYLTSQNIVKEPTRWCEIALKQAIVSTSSRKNHARSFVYSFACLRAQYRLLMAEAPLKFASNAEKEKAFTVLHELVNLLGKNKHSRRTLDALLQFVKPEDVLRDVSLTSSLEAFPGMSSKLESSALSKGLLKPIRRYMLDEVDDAFRIFTDEIDDALNGLGALHRTTVPA